MRAPTNSYERGAIVGVSPTYFAVLVPDYPLTIWVLVPTEDDQTTYLPPHVWLETGRQHACQTEGELAHPNLVWHEGLQEGNRPAPRALVKAEGRQRRRLFLELGEGMCLPCGRGAGTEPTRALAAGNSCHYVRAACSAAARLARVPGPGHQRTILCAPPHWHLPLPNPTDMGSRLAAV